MKIKIEVKKSYKHPGLYGYQVKKIKALHKEELPIEYLGGLSMYKGEISSIPTLIGIDGGYVIFQISENAWYEREFFHKTLNIMTKCGIRLKEINRKKEIQRNSNWEGDEVYVI